MPVADKAVRCLFHCATLAKAKEALEQALAGDAEKD